MIDVPVDEVLARSHVLGADPRVTNFSGGNTSAKVSVSDPATGEPVEVLVVKGSGGDLGTLTAAGLSMLDLGRLRSLRRVYRGAEHEDEMVDLLGFCRFGGGGAAPSIDTAMHGLVGSPHVDHVHPDAVIAFAAAADGERLVAECFGDTVAWVPWRRPGFELGLEIARLHDDHPGLRGVVLGGHGLTAWGPSSDACQHATLSIIREAEEFLAAHGTSRPFGEPRPGFGPLEPGERRRRAAALAPLIRGLVSTDARTVLRFRDDGAILELLAGSEAPRLVALGTSCPDHFLRTKVRPLLLDVPTDTPFDEQVDRLRALHAEYRRDYSAYYERHRDAGSPAMRGADPAIVLVPGVGMFSAGADAQTARVAGEFYINAVNVMRGAESVSTYAPIDEAEKFRIEYWELEERKLRARPRPLPLTGRVALVTGGGSGIGRAIAERLAAEGACVVIADLDDSRAAAVAGSIGDADRAAGLRVDTADERSVDAAVEAACLAFGGIDIAVNCAGLSISKPLVDTTVEDWDRQHDVMARGSFLVSRAVARVLITQGLGGDIVYIASKNALFAGPNNVAYGAAKADQAHQVRLLAAELGEHRIRVNGVNPDGVVRGSGIFANGWGKERAAIYGVPEEELGRFYAERTLLKQEICPEDVAAAVFVLVAGELGRTTGLLIPVDGGVPAAFLR